MLYLDLETRSQCDLLFHGLRRYAEDISTGVICMAYAFDDDDVEFWWGHGMGFPDAPFPQVIIDHIEAGGLITAHNSQFEKHLFDWVIANDYGFTPPKREQWRCSMTRALVCGYPAGLDALAQSLGLQYQKNPQGTRLIREYCAVGHLTEFKKGDAWNMRSYCKSDVEAMREACKCLRDLTDEEWEEFHLCGVINDRGVPVDEAFGLAALGYAQEVADDANANISRLTGGVMTKATQRKSRDAWLFPKLTEYQLSLLVVYKKGEKKMSMDQDHRGYLLACEDLDFEARELLEYINDAGSSALKKYAVAAHTGVDSRVFNTFQFNGAQTGRFSGRGIQPHNFRRDVYAEDIGAELIDAVKEDYEIDAPANTLARLLRGLVYDKAGLYYVDWSAIEGRVAPWVTNGDAAGERKLDLYRDNKDVYIVTAAEMFSLSESAVDKDLRQAGKVCELSLQFGGSHNALIGMARGYGMAFEEEQARDMVDKWRRVNPWAGAIWSDFDKAICGAVQAPGTPFRAGRIIYQSDGENYLWAQLPSGRLLAYPKPRWELYTTPWGEERVGPTFQTHFKPASGEPPLRNHLRGALLFQNSVQAVAADLLRRALVECEAEELEIVLHCHDELVGVGPAEDGELLNEIMLENPSWSKGLPLATGGVVTGQRWGK